MIPRSDLYRLVRKTFQASNEDPAAVFTRWVRDGVVLQPDLDLQDLITAARVLAGEAWEDQERGAKEAPERKGPWPWSVASWAVGYCPGSGLEVVDPATGNFTDRAKIIEVVGGGDNNPSFSGGRARCPECRVFVVFAASGRLLAHRPGEVAPLGRPSGQPDSHPLG